MNHLDFLESESLFQKKKIPGAVCHLSLSKEYFHFPGSTKIKIFVPGDSEFSEVFYDGIFWIYNLQKREA